MENGMLTPTFKLKRFAVQTAYQSVIDAMYKSDAAKDIKSKL